MSGKIYLIVEDETDADAVRALLKRKGFSVSVVPIRIPGKTGGVSRVSSQIDKLITDAKKLLSANDCLVVLCDADVHTDPQQSHQKRIADACKKHNVKYIPAHDSVESWFLADSGVCDWLGKKPKNWDEQAKPKEELDRWLKDKQKSRYESGGRQQVIQHLKGDGDTHSPSLREALKNLDGAPCVRPSPT